MCGLESDKYASTDVSKLYEFCSSMETQTSSLACVNDSIRAIKFLRNSSRLLFEDNNPYSLSRSDFFFNIKCSNAKSIGFGIDRCSCCVMSTGNRTGGCAILRSDCIVTRHDCKFGYSILLLLLRLYLWCDCGCCDKWNFFR